MVLFLLAQLFAIGAGAAAILAYAVRLETRVMIMETRGAEYTVARMDDMKQRIAILEQRQAKTDASIERVVGIMLKTLQQPLPQPQGKPP